MKIDHSLDPIQALLDERPRLGVLAPLQRFMTALPSPSEPAPDTGPVRRLARDIGLLSAAVTGAGAFAALAGAGGLAALAWAPSLACMLIATGQLRKLTVADMHEAGHGVGFDGWRVRGLQRREVRAVRLIVAETASVAALSISAVTYLRGHARHHMLGRLSTDREPDGAELREEGFMRPMKPGSFYPTLVLGKLLNPLWYARKFGQRLQTSLGQGSRIRRGSAAAMWTLLLGSATLLPAHVWLMAVGLPWFVGYPAASLLQVITEHPYGNRKGAKDLAGYAALTWDRIPWDLVPQGNCGVMRNTWAWTRWTGRLMLHLIARATVLDTTMIWHRHHHLAWPLGRPFDDWWAIGHRFVEAWQDRLLPTNWEVNTLVGLGGALQRQRRHLESPEL